MPTLQRGKKKKKKTLTKKSRMGSEQARKERNIHLKTPYVGLTLGTLHLEQDVYIFFTHWNSTFLFKI